MRKTKYDKITKEFLEEEYLVKGKTLKQVSIDNNIPSGTIKYLYKKFAIKTLSHAETNKKLFGKHIDKDILYTKYVTEHKSMKTCGKELNCSPAFVLEYLRIHNIPTRARGVCNKVWNKGLNKETSSKVKQSAVKSSKSKLGKIPWNKGLTKETDTRVAKQAETYKTTHKDFSGKNNPFYGKQHSTEWSTEQSLRKGGTGLPGEYNPYGAEFTYELKEYIRERDNRTCQECGLLEIDNNKGKKLEVHHIDYNKENNDEENLISLCKGCHVATLTNKEYWIAKYSKVLT